KPPDDRGSPVTILTPMRDLADVLDVDAVGGVPNAIPQAAGDGFLNLEECHHVKQGINVQAVQVRIELQDVGNHFGQPVVAAGPAGAIPPVREAGDYVVPG